MRLKISKGRDIVLLHRQNTWLSRPVVQGVEIISPYISKKDRQMLQVKLQMLFNDCGCVWGAPAFLTMLTVMWFVTDGAVWTSTLSVALWLLVGVATALLAKLCAMKESQIRLRRYLTKIEIDLNKFEIGN